MLIASACLIDIEYQPWAVQALNSMLGSGPMVGIILILFDFGLG